MQHPSPPPQFYPYARTAASRTRYAPGSPLLGAIRLPLAIAFPLESVVEQDQLWVPQEAQAITDKNKYDAAFSTTYRRNVLQPVKGALLVLPPLATPASSGGLPRLLPAPIARDEPLRRSGPNAGG